MDEYCHPLCQLHFTDLAVTSGMNKTAKVILLFFLHVHYWKM